MRLPELLPAVQAAERGRFLLAAPAFMCVATAALFSRALGDSLFLSRLGSGALPAMYMIGALVTGVASWGCARVGSRAGTAAVTAFVATVLIAANVASFLALDAFPVAARAAAYLLADVSGRIPILLFWAFAGEIFDARESRRLFGLLGAMGTAACLPAGLLVGPVARHFGVDALFMLICALLAGFIASIRALGKRQVDEPPTASAGLVAANRFSASLLHRNRQFLTIAALAAVTSLVQTLVDYQFKASFSSRASGVALAEIFGRLYAYTSIASLVLQLFFVHRFLRWGGIWLSLSVLPAVLLAASAGILRTASAAWVYAAKAMDITLTLTLNGTARQMLYRGIRSESRLQARALAEGLYQPLAVAVAGSVLAFVVGSVTIRVLAGITMGGCLLWALLARGAHSSYVAGLLSSLRAARFDPSDDPLAAHEPAVKRYVMNALASGDGQDMRYLAAVLPNMLPLADHADPEVRWTVLRAAAAGDFRTKETWLVAKTRDPHPRVCAYAAAALINGAGPAAVRGREVLAALAASQSALSRKAAAEGIGEVRAVPPEGLLRNLLHSEEEEVLEAAVEACLTRPEAALAPSILPMLGRRRLAPHAADAIVAIGDAAVAPAVRYLRSAPRHLRPGILGMLARGLARKGDPAALPLVRRMIRVTGVQDHAPLFQAYADLTRRRLTQPGVIDDLDERVLWQTAAAATRLAEMRALGSSGETSLLRSAVLHVARCHIRHAFILLGARLRNINMFSLHIAYVYGSRESRSQVVELLSNVLPEKVRSAVLDVLAAAELPPDEHVDPRDLVSQLLAERKSEWIAAGAIHAAAALGLSSERNRIRGFLANPDPILRETALAALAKVDDRGVFLTECEPLTADPDRVVRAFASSLLQSCRAERTLPC